LDITHQEGRVGPGSTTTGRKIFVVYGHDKNVTTQL
jgi:hypothetical protein